MKLNNCACSLYDVSAVAKSLKFGEAWLDDYRNAVEEKIIPEMKIAHLFSKVLVLLPHRLLKLLKYVDRVWRVCCRLLRGKTNYSQIKNKISSLGGLYNLILRSEPSAG